MSILTFVTVAVIAYGAFSRRGYGWALALGGATPAGAFVVVGSTAVPTFYAVALGLLVLFGLEFLGARRDDDRRRPLSPGISLLLVFLFWSALVTMIAPLLFDDLPVMLPTSKDASLTAGVLTSSNIAQTIYLTLGVVVAIYLARSPQAGPELIGLAAGLVTVLSLWSHLNNEIGIPFPEGVFDNSPFFAYIESAPGGVERVRGILSEPAGLAGTSLVTVAYMLPRAAQVTGLRRLGAVAVGAAGLYLGLISTSATFVVAGVVLLLVAAGAFAVGFLARRMAVSTTVGVVACLLVIVGMWLVPIAARFVETIVDEKVSSNSFDERSGADSRSYEIILDTVGFGVGLGANRASSFFPGLLSTTGLIGFLLFAAAVALLIRKGGTVPEYRPVVWAFVALIIGKVIAGPDLSDSSGILWMSLGLLSHAALRADSRTGGRPAHAGGPGP